MENKKRSDGKRAKILLVTALVVAAVVLVISIGRIYPPVSQDQATGTIGAVKKYRVQQISDQDVILAGQEAEQAQAPSAALLNDAAKLQNIGARIADVASKLQSAQLEQKTALGNLDTEIEGLNSSIDGMSADLQNRALVNMRDWADAANRLFASNALGAKEEELTALQARLANVTTQLAKLSARLGSADYENLANQLAVINADLAARNTLNNAAVDDMRTQMESYSARLSAAAPLEQKYLVGMKEQLSECASNLKLSARLSNELLEAHSLARKTMAREYEELVNARLELAAMKKARLGSSSELPELASRLSTLGARLSNRSYEIEQETMQNAKAAFLSMSAEQTSLENLSSALELANRKLRARAAELGEREAAEMQARFNAMDQELASRLGVVLRNSLGNLQLQMKLVNSSLENSSVQNQTRNRYLNNCISELNVRLQSRQNLLEKQTMDSCNARLNAMQAKLASMTLESNIR